MNIFQNQHSFLNVIFRSYPCTLPIVLILIYIFNKNQYITALCIGHYLVQLSVPIYKDAIAYPIGKYFSEKYNIDDFPIIGRFKRPKGASNCDCFYVDENNISTTQGMPSGHSMLASFASIFIYYYFVNEYNITGEMKFFVFMMFSLFTLYMMYSRVLMNCHTIQQTIIGALIGFVMGHYYYYYIQNIIRNTYKKKELNNTK